MLVGGTRRVYVVVDYLGLYIDEEDDDEALQHWLGRHRDALTAALVENEDNVAVMEKLTWTARYHNFVVEMRLSDVGLLITTFPASPFASLVSTTA